MTDERDRPDRRDGSDTPESLADAIGKVLAAAPGGGISAIGIRVAIEERWPGAFPSVSVRDVVDHLSLMDEHGEDPHHDR